MSRIPVAVVGATGLAGQEFLASLAGHPQFELKKVAASSRSAGKKFADAVKDDKGSSKWFCREALPPEFAGLVVEDSAKMTTEGVSLVFSAVEADVAQELEPKYARDVAVISTASAFRYEDDVPIFLPGVNWDHAALIETQRKNRGWKGFITPGPNCTTVGLVLTLKPLADAFGIGNVIMTSMQALSGAGRSPGVSAMDILDNIVPYIPKEEEKVEKETLKILGKVGPTGTIVPANVKVSCTCTRVNVLEGHTESVFVELKKKASLDEVKAVWRSFGRELVELGLPSAPQNLITVRDDPFRPQVRLDRDTEGGMSTVVGRLREDNVLGGVKYMLVSHNTRMGAAKGAVLVAEYLAKQGTIKGTITAK